MLCEMRINGKLTLDTYRDSLNSSDRIGYDLVYHAALNGSVYGKDGALEFGRKIASDSNVDYSVANVAIRDAIIDMRV